MEFFPNDRRLDQRMEQMRKAIVGLCERLTHAEDQLKVVEQVQTRCPNCRKPALQTITPFEE